MVGHLLHVQSRVLPMSLEPLTIEADVLGINPDNPDDPVIVSGQHEVAVTHGHVGAIRLVPADHPPVPKRCKAIGESDFVVLRPGSWFTSVLPHLLVPGWPATVQTTAHRVLSLNVSASSETEGISAAQHTEITADHAPQLRFDTIIADAAFAADDKNLHTFAASTGAELVVRRRAPP